MNWVTVSALATAAGTLVLAAATFASVKSANRAARVAERALFVGLRPLLVPSRLDDPPQKVGFADRKWLHVPGGCGVAEATEEAVYLAIALRNASSGIAVLHGWRLYPGRQAGGSAEQPDPATFSRLTRDIYIPAGDPGFWQGSFRDPASAEFAAARDAIADAKLAHDRPPLRRPGRRAAHRQPLRARPARTRRGLHRVGREALERRPARPSIDRFPAVEGDLSGGRSRGRLAGLVVACLVAVSILGRILLGREIPTPWIAPDEMIYGIVGRTLYSSGRLAIENADSDFYSLVYPALIGGPLAWLSPHRGYEVAKALGAVSMSLAAVPAYLWARSIVSKRAAVLVAALTLALPALAYSGLLMTETVFYPVLVLVCWIAALTLVAPTLRNQLLLVGLVAVAVLTRLQAGVLVLVFPTAALLAGVGLRTLPRRFAITFLGFGGIIAAWLIWRLSGGGGALGAYTDAASGHYHLISVVRYVFYHGGDLVLLTGFFPACAAALLWFERRGLSAEARAALSVATALSLWLVLQVGVFASHYVGHLAERDMIAAAPPLFLCLAVWLELGAPRTLRRTLLVSGVALVAVLAWPLHTLLAPAALPDAAGLIPIHRLGHQRLLLDGGLLLAALVLILAPRRILRAVPYVLIALLGAGSVMAEQYAATQARLSQRTMLGPRLDWIDSSAKGPTALLYGDKFQWPAVWESLFWNRKLVGVYALPGAKLIGPAPGAYVALSNSAGGAGRGKGLATALCGRRARVARQRQANRRRRHEPGRDGGAMAALAARRPTDPGRQGQWVPAERGHLPGCHCSRLRLPRRVETDASRQAGRTDHALPAGKPLPTPEREAGHGADKGAARDRPLPTVRTRAVQLRHQEHRPPRDRPGRGRPLAVSPVTTSFRGRGGPAPPEPL